MRVFKSRFFPFFRCKAMAMWPFIFVREGFSEADLNHERIHGEQQKELLLIGFVLLYILLFLLRLFRYCSWKKACSTCPFETEACFWEHDMGYLNQRERFAWWKNVSYSFKL